MLGLELASLQLLYHEAVQAVVVEQQVDEKILAIDRHIHLPPHKGKALTHFHQQFGDVAGHGGFDLALVRLIGHPKKVKQVWVFQRLLRQFGLGRRQSLIKVGNGLTAAMVQLGGDVMPHDVTRPPMLDSLDRIPLALFTGF